MKTDDLKKMLASIEKLRKSDVFDEAAYVEFDRWEQQIMQSMAAASLFDNDFVKMMVHGHKARIEQIEGALMNKKSSELSDHNRDVLIIERDLRLTIVNDFTGRTQELETISRQIIDNLAEIPRRHETKPQPTANEFGEDQEV